MRRNINNYDPYIWLLLLSLIPVFYFDKFTSLIFRASCYLPYELNDKVIYLFSFISVGLIYIFGTMTWMDLSKNPNYIIPIIYFILCVSARLLINFLNKFFFK